MDWLHRLLDRIIAELEQWIPADLQPLVWITIAAAFVAFNVGWFSGAGYSRSAIRALRKELETGHIREGALESREAAARDEAKAARVMAEGVEESLRRYIARVRAAIDGQILTRPFAQNDRPRWEKGGPSRIPILAIANLKGGVGKTTLAANLGAVLADSRDQGLGRKWRVLFVDLDFQGSLSETLYIINRDDNHSRVERIFDPGARPESLWQEAPILNHPQMSGCRYFDCDFESSKREDRLLFEWAVDDNPQRDPRLGLTRLLHNPIVQQQFDLVVLDLPPRNTMFAISAFIAATHVVVPTRLDAISARAVARLLGFLEQHRTTLWPHLSVAGVVAMMTEQGTLKPYEERRLKDALGDAEDAWSKPRNKPIYLGAVPTRTAVAQIAGRDFVIFADPPGSTNTPYAYFAEIAEKLSPSLH